MKIAKKCFAICIGAAALAASQAYGQDKLELSYIIHDNPDGVFWNVVKKGMVDACEDLDVSCQMIGVPGGDMPRQLQNFMAAAASGVDGIVTTIPDDTLFDAAIKDAVESGVPVIGVNTDDVEGADGNARMAYIGSSLEKAAYDLAAAVTERLPESGDIHILLGIADFTQNFAIQRNKGFERALNEWKDANPDRNITWEAIESSNDGAVVANRVGAYLQAHPETTAYIDSSIWGPQVAAVLRDAGKAPGEVLVASFEAYNLAIDELKTGYLQVVQEQGAYLQGYLPIVGLKLIAEGLQPFDIDTAGSESGIVDSSMADTLSPKRIWSLN